MWLKDEYWALKSVMEQAKPLIAKEIGLLASHHVEAGAVQQHRINQMLSQGIQGIL